MQKAITMKRTPFGSPTLSDQALMPFPSLKMGPRENVPVHTLADEFIFVKESRGGDRNVFGVAGRSENLNYHYLFSHGSGFSFSFSFLNWKCSTVRPLSAPSEKICPRVCLVVTSSPCFTKADDKFAIDGYIIPVTDKDIEQSVQFKDSRHFYH